MPLCLYVTMSQIYYGRDYMYVRIPTQRAQPLIHMYTHSTYELVATYLCIHLSSFSKR